MMNQVRHLSAISIAALMLFTVPAFAERIGRDAPELSYSETSLRIQTPDKSRRPFRPDSFIVVLDEIPTLAFKTKTKMAAQKGDGGNATAQTSRDPILEHIGQIEQQQLSFISTAKSLLPAASIEYQFRDIVNGVVIRSSHPQAEAILGSISGVKYVMPDELITKHMDVSLPIVRAPEAWELVGGRSEAGRNIRVAVIDSGIVPEHPMFDSTAFEKPSDLPDDDYCATDPDFCNGKLIVARHYTPSEMHSSEVDTPYDIDGHGTHVAGTAVGNTVFTSEGKELSGVAPGAYLMAYKALWSNGLGSATGSTSGLVRALQDAVSDGADVINNSWGGDASLYGYRFYNDIFGTLEAAGVMLVTSAGNSGPSASTVGCPACAEPGLAVASTETRESSNSNSVVTYGDLTLNSVPGGNVIHNNDATATALPAEALSDSNTDACATYAAGTFDNSIGIVYRGGETPDGGACYFYVKAANLKAAGAQGMIVINNRPGDAITMGGLEDLFFPSVMISQEQGRELIAAYQQDDPITIGAFLVRTVPVSAMSGFSSRGPNIDVEVLKPDIAAPGNPILSAGLGSDDTSYVSLGGTSMASPHVAGAAAVVLQNSPNLTPKQLKSTLMNAANPSAALNAADATAASVFASGAGMMDIPSAMANEVFLDTVSIASYCIASCTYTVSGQNTGLDTRSFDLSIEFNSSYATVELQESIDLAGEETFELSFTANVSEVESGWLNGRLMFTSLAEGVPNLAVPMAIYVGSQVDESVLNLSGTIAAGVRSELQAQIAGVSGAEVNTLYSLKVQNPDNLSLISSSVTETALNVTDSSLSADAETGAITWSGKLNALDGSINESSFFGTGKSLENDFPTFITDSLGCDDTTARPNGCDELTWTFMVGSLGISIAGESMEHLQITPNGLTVFNPSDADKTASTWSPETIPSATLPNNILAPFWTDLVLGGDGSISDLSVGSVQDGNDRWFVVEWFNAREYDTDGPMYTFSLWMKENSSDVFFNYVDLPATPTVLSVGVEDGTGSSGVSLYNASEGSAPQTGTSQAVDITSFQGSATISYQVDSEELATVADTELTAPANGDLYFDLTGLVEFNNSSGTAVAQLDVDGKRYESEISHVVPSATVGYQILTTPTHGEVIGGGANFSYNGQFVYRANKAFVGQDSFTFRVVDANNFASESREATVLVTVEDTGIDNDEDGLSDQQEYDLGTDPFDPDSDDDGLNDGKEVELGTDPNKADSDGDGYTDGEEVAAGTDPNDATSFPAATTEEEDSGLPIWALYIASSQTGDGDSDSDTGDGDEEEPVNEVDLDKLSHSKSTSVSIINGVIQAGSKFTSRLSNQTGADLAVDAVRFYSDGVLKAQVLNYQLENDTSLGLTWEVSSGVRAPITVTWTLTHDGSSFEKTYTLYE